MKCVQLFKNIVTIYIVLLFIINRLRKIIKSYYFVSRYRIVDYQFTVWAIDILLLGLTFLYKLTVFLYHFCSHPTIMYVFI